MLNIFHIFVVETKEKDKLRRRKSDNTDSEDIGICGVFGCTPQSMRVELAQSS